MCFLTIPFTHPIRDNKTRHRHYPPMAYHHSDTWCVRVQRKGTRTDCAPGFRFSNELLRVEREGGTSNGFPQLRYWDVTWVVLIDVLALQYWQRFILIALSVNMNSEQLKQSHIVKAIPAPEYAIRTFQGIICHRTIRHDAQKTPLLCTHISTFYS